MRVDHRPDEHWCLDGCDRDDTANEWPQGHDPTTGVHMRSVYGVWVRCYAADVGVVGSAV